MWKRIVAYGTAAIMGIVCAVGFFGVFMITTVTGSGMEPFYKEGHCVLVCKAAYQKSIPEVGEVVALWNQVYSEDGEGSVLIRRIAARQGDQIEIRDNVFYRNGKPYMAYMSGDGEMEDLTHRTLGEGELFLLCDDRGSSMDSRNDAVGIVDVGDCIGKVCFP